MIEGKCKNEWTHTSFLLSAIFNASGNLKKGTSVTPNDFNPYYKRKENIKANWAMFKEACLGMAKKSKK